MSQEAAVPAKPHGLTIPQMLHLMQLEMDRARAYDYPITCFMIGIDGLDGTENLDLRRGVITQAFRELKAATFQRHVRGLGLTCDHFLLALFPHIKPEMVRDLASDLVARGRRIQCVDGAVEHPITLSIGIGHNLHPGVTSFDGLLNEAEAGMNVARSGGGDKCVQWKEVESELDRLREDLEESIQELEAQSKRLAKEEEGANYEWGRGLIGKVLQVFRHEPESSPGIIRLEKQVVELVSEEVDRWCKTSHAQQLSEREERITMLERRIRKLTESLASTESELKRIAKMKNIETGLESIYRSVQGLTGEDDDYEAKKEMLSGIFEANLRLQGMAGN